MLFKKRYYCWREWRTIKIVIKTWNFVLKSLTLTSGVNDFVDLVAGFAGIATRVQDSPVVEDTLREGLTRGLRSQVSGETERF